MAEKKASDITQKWNQLWYETGQAVVQTTFDVQERSVQYVLNSFSDGVETLKSHVEASQHWFEMEQKPSEQREAMSSWMGSGVEAYKRNLAFLQRITERGTETFMANTESERELAQTLLKKAQDQQILFFSERI